MCTSRILSLALMGLGVLFANAATAATAYARPTEPRYLRLRLQPTGDNVPSIGTAVLEPAGDKTGVEVEIGRVPDFAALPVHLYTYLYEGRCGDRSAKRYALDHISTAMDYGLARSMTSVSGTVPVAFEQVRSKPYAVSVQLAPADGGREIFCGDGGVS